MFGFMKKQSDKHDKDKDDKDKDKKKKDKKDKRDKRKERAMTQEELNRLEEAKKGLFRKLSDVTKVPGKTTNGGHPPGVTASESSESVSSASKGSREGTPEEPPTGVGEPPMYKAPTGKIPPRTRPKPPKKGILKEKSSYGSTIPNQGVRGNLDDTQTLEENTIANEVLSAQLAAEKVRRRQEEEKLARQRAGAGGDPERRARSVKSMVSSFECEVGEELPTMEAPVAPPPEPQPQRPTSIKRAKPSHAPPPIPKNPPPSDLVAAAATLPPSLPQIITPDVDGGASLDAMVHVESDTDTDTPTGREPQPLNPTPAEKTYDNVDLQLPHLAPPRRLVPREITLKRQPAGDFGFSLRRGTVLERGVGDNSERKRTVIFAEPGPKNAHTGLLPGDRLIEVNGTNVETASREEIIELIRASGGDVRLKVQPIPELSELSVRSGLEGEDVLIDQSNVKMGTLQRSGSMRYSKAKTAKSEDQVATERAWLSAERVWLVHKGGFAAARHQQPAAQGADQVAEGRCKVKLDVGQEVLEVDEDDVERMNPPQFDRVEDLTSLRYLNESSILHTLRQRYGSNLIHSYAGSSLLLLNPMHPLSIYSEKVIQMFRGCKPEDMPPHIYATAQIAYRHLLNSRRDQSIVFLGRSGSGKTTNLRHILHYYMVAAGAANKILTVEKLNALFVLMDAFGNSRTILNTSATRYTQVASLDFDNMGQIASVSLQVLMLEKTRITHRPEGEPAFHVFYQMLAGIDSQLRKELQLENLNEPNLFMTPLQRSEDRQRATQTWAKIHHSMTVLGVTDSETKAIFCVLATIYHLGVAGAVKGPNNKYQFARPAAAQRAADILGVSAEELSRAIFSPPTSTPPQRQGVSRHTSLRVAPQERPEVDEPPTVAGLEALEGFVAGLYAEVFNALVSLINRTLSSNCRTVASILIVDTPGFQNPSSCGRHTGATFGDLCHNYVQERLQLLFHETVFTQAQDLYSQENVECDFEPVKTSPALMVSLMDKASQQALVRSPNREVKDEPRGLLWLLDEEAIFPGSSDETFLARLMQHPSTTKTERPATEETAPEEGGDFLMKKGTQAGSFVLNHYQGTNPVQYTTKGWLKAARESPITRAVTGFLQDSHRDEVRELFTSVRGTVGGLVSGSVAGMDGSSSLRRTASMRRTFTSGTAALKRKSLCLQVKFHVDAVVDSLRRTRMHFVHCLLPQSNAGLCDLRAASATKTSPEDILLNVPLLRLQLRGAEIVEAIRINRQGFPEHMQFAEFRQRFDILAPADAKPSGPIVDERAAVEQLLAALDIDKATYRLGLSQAFFRAGGLSQLENAREEKIAGTIIRLQSFCRGYASRQRLQKRKLQQVAVTCIQRNVKKFMAIRNWSWWRLYTKIQPLLDVHKTEDQLKNTETELEQLKLKYERIEKERSEFKQAVDRLETKLSETSADLVEEHTTSAQASEILETETAERLRLERDFKEMQAKYSALQRKHEQAEMDLMHSRMLAATMDGDLEDDDDEEDSIYRERFIRLRREMDFMRKKLQQQHEEELDQREAGRKQLERKLGESRSEAEEHQRHVSNQKKKSARLAQDLADLKLHLEEQVSRNSELEKKQRRFDSELHKVNDQLHQERLQREKLHRERDEVVAERFTKDQELKSVQMDYDLQKDKLDRLERDLRDLSSTNKDDGEAASLRRLRGELEQKLADQEEELDEQAGTIQQLEQAKLRLEMEQGKLRQAQAKELDEREQELEQLRASTQKKVRTLESQLEEEYEAKQAITRERRELERRLQDLDQAAPVRDKDLERRLRRDLRRTKALLQDAQLMLDKNKEGATSRSTLKQLRNQLEDCEFVLAAAVKARKGAEMEVAELQQQIEDISRSKQDAEDRCMQLSREKNDLQSRADESEEDFNEMMKKYKAVVLQQSVDNITITDQSKQIEELQRENQSLKEQVGQLQSRVDFLQDSTVDKQAIVRLEAKIRELESKLDFEVISRTKAEGQVSRGREQVDKMTEERDRLQDQDLKQQEVTKRVSRQLRDLREEYGELERKELEASQRKHDLERKVDSLETERDTCQTDLKLAFRRIADLQSVIDDEMMSDDSDLDSTFALHSDEYSDSDDDQDFRSSLISTRMPLASRTSRGSSSGDASHVTSGPSHVTSGPARVEAAVAQMDDEGGDSEC